MEIKNLEGKLINIVYLTGKRSQKFFAIRSAGFEFETVSIQTHQISTETQRIRLR